MKKNKTHFTKKNFNFFLQKSRSGFFLLIILLFSFTSLSGQRPFTTVWDVPTSREINLWITGSGSYSYLNIDDGITNGVGTFSSTNYTYTTIKFPKKGNYRLNIIPTTQLRLTVDSKNQFLELSQWGDVNWSENLSSMFQGCLKLKFTASDIPDFKNVKDVSYMFSDCKADNIPGIENWDFGNVINMSHMFDGASKFDQNIGSWNTSNVTDMSYMFVNTYSLYTPGDGNTYTTGFNQNIGNWNTSKVKDMSFMFNNAINFNQPLGNWNVGAVISMDLMFNNAIRFNQPLESWNVSNVISMAYMFEKATSFNQPIGNWNVSKVGNMSGILKNATNFNQNLGNWNLEGLASPFGNEIYLDKTAISCENYKNTLKGWVENPSNPTNIGCYVQDIKYGNIGKTYRDLLLGKGWKFYNDMYIQNCNDLSSSESLLNKLTVYPNPFKDTFNVKLEDSVSKTFQLQIFSTAGELVYQKIYKSSKEIKVSPDKNLPIGVYTVILSSDKNSKSFQIIRK